VLLGFTPFSASVFWLSLYLQNVLNYSTLSVAVHLLPQAIAGILVNILAGAILHRVNNKLLVMIGAMSYFGAMLLFATMRYGDQTEKQRYWSRLFPALVLSVIGADLQFNVANVCVPQPNSSFHLYMLATFELI
jgi:predicted MFS family arabinose efflux permease